MLGLIFYYFSWHYTEALADISRHIRNFLWFLYNFFSIPLLFKTLIEPWQRLEEHYRGGLHLADLGSVILVNLIMRLVGLVVRLFFIVFGVLVLISAGILAIIWVILWLLLPILLVSLIVAGTKLLFS